MYDQSEIAAHYLPYGVTLDAARRLFECSDIVEELAAKGTSLTVRFLLSKDDGRTVEAPGHMSIGDFRILIKAHIAEIVLYINDEAVRQEEWLRF